MSIFKGHRAAGGCLEDLPCSTLPDCSGEKVSILTVPVPTEQNAALAKDKGAPGGNGGASTKEGLDTVKAQLKGYTKGMEVSKPLSRGS